MRNPRRVLSQGADPRPGLELRLRRAGQRRRALHLVPAQEDRRRPGADDPHRARRRLRAPARPAERMHPTVTLRTRLLAALLALLAAVCVVVGVASVLALRSFLTDRLDSQLATASARLGGGPDDAEDHPPPPQRTPPPGLADGTLNARIRRRDASTRPGSISGSTYTQLTGCAAAGAAPALPVDGRAAHPRPGRRPRRLPAAARSRRPDGDVSITGLPLSGVRDTVDPADGDHRRGRRRRPAAGRRRRRADRPADPAPAAPGRRHRDAGSPSCRWTGARSRSPSGCRTPTPTRAPRSARSAPRSTGCSATSATALTARQASETRVRQFVADASHELRTPLASIRGYAELTRRGRRAGAARRRARAGPGRVGERPDDRPGRGPAAAGPAGRRPRARARAGRPDPAGGRRGQRCARAAGPDHSWVLELPAEPVERGRRRRPAAPGGGQPAGQRPRAHPGRHHRHHRHCPRQDGSVAVASVTTTGRASRPSCCREVFERFARGDGSRSRAAGSTGLGLAIVAAVVEAHGGTVGVDSSAAGTTFTVRLPGSCHA